MIILLKNTYKRGAWFYEKRFYCLLAAVLMAGACICVPVAEVKAEDGYNIDSYDNDDWYDSDDSPTDMVLDLSNVTIDKTSQPKRMQEKFYDCSSLVWKSYHKNGVNFGIAYYAPVAADMGKWCVQHKKLVSGGLSQANIQNMKLNPIIITSPIVRMYFKKLTEDYFKDLIVVSYNEVESDVELQSVGMVTA